MCTVKKAKICTLSTSINTDNTRTNKKEHTHTQQQPNKTDNGQIEEERERESTREDKSDQSKSGYSFSSAILIASLFSIIDYILNEINSLLSDSSLPLETDPPLDDDTVSLFIGRRD